MIPTTCWNLSIQAFAVKGALYLKVRKVNETSSSHSVCSSVGILPVQMLWFFENAYICFCIWDEGGDVAHWKDAVEFIVVTAKRTGYKECKRKVSTVVSMMSFPYHLAA